jgi:NAD(P)-dependent dehydrogenase (short-subunit alcohol dehydrogenase family)
MSSLKGTVILTGVNGGLGSAFVDEFLKTPHAALYKGIYTIRDPLAAHNLQPVLKNSPGNHSYEVSALDLNTLENVRDFAASINNRITGGSLPRIRVLILNAAVEFFGKPNFTNDGIEATFAVNYLANFLLVLLLLQSIDPEHGRIICIGSTIHDPAKNSWAYSARQSKIVFTDIDKLAKGEETFEEEKEWLWGFKRYGMSKVLMNMFMFVPRQSTAFKSIITSMARYELQRRLTADPKLTNISILSLDPAAVGGTGITRRGPLQVRVSMTLLKLLQPLFVYFWPNGPLRTPAKAARDMLYVSFNEKTLGEHPKALYVDGTVISNTSPESRNEEKQKLLWEGSLRIAGVKEGDTVLQGWK